MCWSRKLVMAACLSGSLIIGLGAANAADTLASQSWSGFYAGLGVEYGWGESDNTTFRTDGIGPVKSTSVDVDGLLGSARIGFDHQMGSWVVGVIGDISAGDMEGTGVTLAPGPGGDFRTEIDYNWLATVRLRGGYLLMPNLLIYAHGGLAVAEIDQSVTRFNVPPAGRWTQNNSDTAVGWTAGIGAEGKITNKISAGVEYAHIDLGESSTTVFPPSGPPNLRFFGHDNTSDQAKVFVNFRF